MTKMYISHETPKELTKEGFEKLEWTEIKGVTDVEWSKYKYKENTWESKFFKHLGICLDSDIIDEAYIDWLFIEGGRLSQIKSAHHLKVLVRKGIISRYL